MQLPTFKCLLLAAFLPALALPAHSEEILVAPVGAYADIDLRDDVKMIERLTSRSKRKREKAIEAFFVDPSTHSPPVIYALASALFKADRKDEAALWYYSGQVRARFDANRCADSSAAQAVNVLNQTYGEPINQHAFQDLQKLRRTVYESVAWDEETPHNYDHRWINTHGMAAMIASLEGSDEGVVFSKPESDWSEIAKTTRADYLRDFEEAMVMFESMTGAE